jgi:hypothetical protein
MTLPSTCRWIQRTGFVQGGASKVVATTRFVALHRYGCGEVAATTCRLPAHGADKEAGLVRGRPRGFAHRTA